MRTVPTHQPIEHLAALRAIPGLDIVRPADANETAAAWRTILERTDRPAGLALTRQNVPTFPRGTDGYADTSNVSRGAYVLLDVDGGAPDVVLIGTGSEVQIAVAAREQLADDGHPGSRGVDAVPRVVRGAGQVLPRHRDPADRQGSRLRRGRCRRWAGATSSATPAGSCRLDHFGASADYQRLYLEFGLTAEAVTQAAKDSIAAADARG